MKPYAKLPCFGSANCMMYCRRLSVLLCGEHVLTHRLPLCRQGAVRQQHTMHGMLNFRSCLAKWAHLGEQVMKRTRHTHQLLQLFAADVPLLLATLQWAPLHQRNPVHTPCILKLTPLWLCNPSKVGIIRQCYSNLQLAYTCMHACMLDNITKTGNQGCASALTHVEYQNV